MATAWLSLDQLDFIAIDSTAPSFLLCLIVGVGLFGIALLGQARLQYVS